MLLLVSLVALGCSSPTSPDPETLVGSFSLQSPAGESQLTPGAYESAERYPFRAAGRPGLNVEGEGRGCNRLSGRFIIVEAVYGIA